MNLAKNRDKVFSFKEVQDKLPASDEEDSEDTSNQSTDRELLNKRESKKSLAADSKDDMARQTSVSSKK